jgi:hypothetical protein
MWSQALSIPFSFSSRFRIRASQLYHPYVAVKRVAQAVYGVDTVTPRRALSKAGMHLAAEHACARLPSPQVLENRCLPNSNCLRASIVLESTWPADFGEISEPTLRVNNDYRPTRRGRHRQLSGDASGIEMP